MSNVRIGVGLVYMAVATLLHSLLLLLMFPSRNARIRACNYWGWLTGRFCMWLSGSTLTISGGEHFDGSRPAIYISNHTSILDIFLGIWQAPAGTVGVAKKEVVYYPFFGQLYWLSGHLMLDRSNHHRAMEAMEDLHRIVSGYGLSIWMWPEGTRSRDGRLLPFRKGLWHLAVQTGLPIVPVVVAGAHEAWKKGSVKIHYADITVTALPAIDTSDWKDRGMEECIEEVHALFRDCLPPSQLPLDVAA